MTCRPHRLKKTSSMQSKRRALHHQWLHRQANNEFSYYCYLTRWINKTFFMRWMYTKAKVSYETRYRQWVCITLFNPSLLPRSVNFDLVETGGAQKLQASSWNLYDVLRPALIFPFIRIEDCRSIFTSSSVPCTKFSTCSIWIKFIFIMLESWGFNVWFSLSM